MGASQFCCNIPHEPGFMRDDLGEVCAAEISSWSCSPHNINWSSHPPHTWSGNLRGGRGEIWENSNHQRQTLRVFIKALGYVFSGLFGIVVDWQNLLLVLVENDLFVFLFYFVMSWIITRCFVQDGETMVLTRNNLKTTLNEPLPPTPPSPPPCPPQPKPCPLLPERIWYWVGWTTSKSVPIKCTR